MTTTSFPVLDRAECAALLACTSVGRIAFATPDGVVLLPVNYRVLDGDVVIRTSTGGSLAQLAAEGDDREVVFEVDYHAPTSREAWSVLVRGTCATVSDPSVLTSREVTDLVSWTTGPHQVVLALRPRLITGRRVG